MELFDFISVAVSIVLGISAAHLLSALRDVVAPGRRDWLVVLWFAYVAYLHLLTWWSLFATRDLPRWNLLNFGLVLAVPGLLYLSMFTLVSESPAAVASWREHFQRIRPWFFVFYGLFISASAVRETLLLNRPLLSTASAVDAVSIVNATVGAVIPSRTVQVPVAAVEIGLAILVSAARFYGSRP